MFNITSVNSLINKVKRINTGNKLLVTIFEDAKENTIKLNYQIYGVVSTNGTECFTSQEAINEFITDLMEKYYVFGENCYVWRFINDLED